MTVGLYNGRLRRRNAYTPVAVSPFGLSWKDQMVTQ